VQPSLVNDSLIIIT